MVSTVRMGDGQYGRVHARVSSKQTKKTFLFKLKETETQSAMVVFRFVSFKQKIIFGIVRFDSVCFNV